jgi:hypothetical protein
VSPLEDGADDGRLRYFAPGADAGPPDLDRVAVPVGEPCAHCGEAIAPDDAGVSMAAVLAAEAGGWRTGRLPYHATCFQRTVLGSVGHVLGQCSCYGGDPDADLDPPGLTRREAAALAVALWRRRLGPRVR